MDYILIGKIVNIHGIKGEVKVYPYTDDIHNLSKIKEFYLDNNGKEKYIVESARVHKNMLIVKIKDLSDPDEALRLKNKDIFIPKENLEKLDEETYYVFELIGLEVLDMDGNKIRVRGREELAIAFQHEYDHLNGILFIDKIDKKNPFKDQDKMRGI